jgi:hypothetical protein
MRGLTVDIPWLLVAPERFEISQASAEFPIFPSLTQKK